MASPRLTLACVSENVANASPQGFARTIAVQESNLDYSNNLQALQQQLEAERRERTSGLEALRRDMDAQQTVLADVIGQVSQIKAAAPKIEQRAEHNERRLGDLAADLEGLRQGVEAQQEHQDIQAGALREGLVELQLQREALSKLSTGQELSPRLLATSLGAQAGVEDSTATTVAATQATRAAAAAARAAAKATVEFTELLGAEREARCAGLAEISARVSKEITDALRLVELRAAEYRTLLEASSSIGERRHKEMVTQVAELWEQVDVRISEITQRLVFLETPRGGECATNAAAVAAAAAARLDANAVAEGQAEALAEAEAAAATAAAAAAADCGGGLGGMSPSLCANAGASGGAVATRLAGLLQAGGGVQASEGEDHVLRVIHRDLMKSYRAMQEFRDSNRRGILQDLGGRAVAAFTADFAATGPLVGVPEEEAVEAAEHAADRAAGAGEAELEDDAAERAAEEAASGSSVGVHL